MTAKLIKERVQEIDKMNEEIVKIKNAPFIKEALIPWLKENNLVLLHESTIDFPQFYASHQDVMQLFNHLSSKNEQQISVYKKGYSDTYSFKVGSFDLCQAIRIPKGGHLMKLSSRTADDLLKEDALQFKLRTIESYTNPREKIDDWKELLDKDDVVLSLVSPITPPKSFKNPLSEKIQKTVMEDFVANNKEIILVGGSAYNILIKESGFKHPNLFFFRGTVVEVLSREPAKHTKEIQEMMSKLYPELEFLVKTYPNIITSQNYTRETLYLGNQRIVEIYNISDRCTPYVEFSPSEGTSIQLGSVHLVQLYLLVGTWVASKIGDPILKNGIVNMVAFLDLAISYWLEGKGLTGLEDKAQLFRVFQYECLGTHLTGVRKARIALWTGDTKLYRDFSMKSKKNVSKLEEVKEEPL